MAAEESKFNIDEEEDHKISASYNGRASKVDSEFAAATAASLANEDNNNDTGGGAIAPDEEVLEQYKIMAQYEARARVMENTGLDIDEIERKSKNFNSLREIKNKKDLYGGGKKTKLRLPDPKILPYPSKYCTVELKAEKPPSAMFFDYNNLTSSGSASNTYNIHIKQKYPRVDEMCSGTLSRGTSSTLSSGGTSAALATTEHIVRCLGCRKSLKVNFYATLVDCPECHTVSSTTSTRL